MIKKFMRAVLFASLAVSFTACSSSRQNNNTLSYEMTLVAVPRVEQSVKIAKDVGSKGYPIILVAYEETGEKVNLHAWNGTEWVYVSPEDYKAGVFFEEVPARVVLVGKDGKDVPEELLPSSNWCNQVYRTNSNDPVSLLNFFGTGFKFSYPHWQWFADRYGYTVAEINPEYLSDKWYYHNLKDYYNRRVNGIEYESDVVEVSEPSVDSYEPIEVAPVSTQINAEFETIATDLDKQVEIVENPLDDVPPAEEVVIEDVSSMTE